MTEEQPRQAPPGVQIGLALVAIAGGLVLLSDGLFAWSAADSVIRWSYLLLVPLLLVPGVALFVLAIRRAAGASRSGQ